MDKLESKFAKGCERELEAVMEAYGAKLLRYCHHVLCDYYEAQDALQVTFIKAYNKRATFKEGMALSPWLYRIAYTTCMDILRKRKMRSLLYTKPAEDEYISEEVLEALMTLSAADRALVYARVMEEQSYETLAKIHGMRAATLRKRYERAKGKLAAALQKDYPYYAKLEESK